MNIRVDLNYPIKDGTEVVFRSPVDCSQVTGLKVYYPNGSQEFSFADAHGNNVGDIDHLFAENVVVKVILDVTTSMAFVQNADTNAYLEGRFDGIVDKLCPSFSESGTIVTCEPVEGYPLSITAEEGATKITRCGKNLLDDGWRVWDSYDKNNNFILSLPPGKYTASAKHAEPKLESYLFIKYSKDGGVSWNNIDTNLVANLKTNVAKFDVTAEEIWALSTAKAIYLPRIESVQIELGTEATDHEPFRGSTFSVGEPVPAIAGVNYIYADAGSVTVAGKSDLVSIIDKLTKTVSALLEG